MKQKKQKKNTGKKIALVLALVLTLIDGVLIYGLKKLYGIHPQRQVPLNPAIVKDFEPNANDYWKEEQREEYSTELSFSFGEKEEQEQLKEEENKKNTVPLEKVHHVYAGFVFPESGVKELSDQVIAEHIKTEGDFHQAINEMYARRGYAFTKKENQDFYNQYDWYREMPKESNMDLLTDQMTALEKENLMRIARFGESKGW